MRGGSASSPIQALARPPRAPWEAAPAGPTKPPKQHNGVSNDKAQGGAVEGCQGICGRPGGLVRRHNGDLSVDEDNRQKPRIARCGETSWWDVL